MRIYSFNTTKGIRWLDRTSQIYILAESAKTDAGWFRHMARADQHSSFNIFLCCVWDPRGEMAFHCMSLGLQ